VQQGVAVRVGDRAARGARHFHAAEHERPALGEPVRVLAETDPDVVEEIHATRIAVMTPTPHSQGWYVSLADQHGRYEHPWKQRLLGPGGEDLYTSLLEAHLAPNARVLEAGCGHGPDAARYAPRVARWVGYDFAPGFLETARREVPGAEFVVWHSGREAPPTTVRPPFDLIVSRRGPTSVIDHLGVLAAPGASFLYVGPGGDDLATRVRTRLAANGVVPAAEWTVRARGFLPTFEDYALRCAYNSSEPSRAEWEAGATDEGLCFVEERFVCLARLP